MIFDMPFVEKQNEGAGEEKEKQQGGDLISKLLKTRTVMVTDEVTKKMAQQIMTQLLLLEAENNDDIKMYINSPGGDADAGFAIFDMMRFVKPKIKAICAGVAASAAVIILLGAKKENRFSLLNARVLIHQPSTGIHGTAADIQIEASEILKCREKINRLISVETGQTMGKVESDTKRNFWMSAEEALKYGLVSKIIQTSDDLK
ncbi:MAG: ATP-dependent Clp protease proteolytic subunit [Candidatus Brocadiales bacterium]|nr:ATP-dependent Clp protease proteolytic subunit [Candidatus Brocadiales bacterium]